MPLPSFYRSDESARAWRVDHAAAYGGLLGAMAALFKTANPFGQSGGMGLTTHVLQITLAALGFAFLCVAAAVARNFLVRQLAGYASRGDRRIGK